MITLTASYKDVADYVKAAHPSYSGRRDVSIVSAERVELNDTYWSGGRRTLYAALDVATKSSIPLPSYNPPQFGGPTQAPFVPLKDDQGRYIVVVAWAQGNFEHITFYVHPDVAPKLIPASTGGLTEDEKTVLVYTRSLQSSYAGISNYRYHEAHQKTGITLQRWEDAKSQCIAKGLLNKRGAITPDGKNAIANERRLY